MTVRTSPLLNACRLGCTLLLGLSVSAASVVLLKPGDFEQQLKMHPDAERNAAMCQSQIEIWQHLLRIGLTQYNYFSDRFAQSNTLAPGDPALRDRAQQWQTFCQELERKISALKPKCDQLAATGSNQSGLKGVIEILDRNLKRHTARRGSDTNGLPALRDDPDEPKDPVTQSQEKALEFVEELKTFEAETESGRRVDRLHGSLEKLMNKWNAFSGVVVADINRFSPSVNPPNVSTSTGSANRLARGSDGRWRPSAGYRFATQNPQELEVVWEPGQPHRGQPHVVAGKKENEWSPEPGYRWLNEAQGDFRVIWEPGQWHSSHANVVAGVKEGEWSPAPGFKWMTNDPQDMSVMKIENSSEALRGIYNGIYNGGLGNDLSLEAMKALMYQRNAVAPNGIYNGGLGNDLSLEAMKALMYQRNAVAPNRGGINSQDYLDLQMKALTGQLNQIQAGPR